MSASPADLDRRFYAFVLDRLVTWSLDAAAIALCWYLLGDNVGAGQQVQEG